MTIQEIAIAKALKEMKLDGSYSNFDKRKFFIKLNDIMHSKEFNQQDFKASKYNFKEVGIDFTLHKNNKGEFKQSPIPSLVSTFVKMEATNQMREIYETNNRMNKENEGFFTRKINDKKQSEWENASKQAFNQMVSSYMTKGLSKEEAISKIKEGLYPELSKEARENKLQNSIDEQKSLVKTLQDDNTANRVLLSSIQKEKEEAIKKGEKVKRGTDARINKLSTSIVNTDARIAQQNNAVIEMAYKTGKTLSTDNEVLNELQKRTQEIYDDKLQNRKNKQEAAGDALKKLGKSLYDAGSWHLYNGTAHRKKGDLE